MGLQPMGTLKIPSSKQTKLHGKSEDLEKAFCNLISSDSASWPVAGGVASFYGSEQLHSWFGVDTAALMSETSDSPFS
jgi:hypothetical protein